MKPNEEKLIRRIEKVKMRLHEITDMRPGKLSQQYNVCGSPTCKCKANPPQKHGPYYQISFTRKGKSSSRFVKKEDLELVRRQLRDYVRLRALVDEWIDLGGELAELRLEAERETRSRSSA